MLLAVDIGNSNIVVGVFVEEELAATWRLATDVHKTADEYALLVRSLFQGEGLEPAQVKGVILSSVVPPLVSSFEEVSRRYFRVEPLVVGTGIRTGVRISTDNPREVGADRIVNALAAYKLYGGPAIVIDFGTATTFDAVSRQGDYLGGAIAPGIGVALEALFQHAAKLPQVELTPPPHAIGKNTVASMQAGIIFGYVGLVEGIVHRIQRELGGQAKVIATGGLAEIIAGQTPVIEVVDQKLTLIGLRFIYEMNQRG